jgi:uncharacterized protein (DUF1330 family)
MPAYLVSTIDVHDPAGYEEYKKLVPPILAKYGGRFVVAVTRPNTGRLAPEKNSHR